MGTTENLTENSSSRVTSGGYWVVSCLAGVYALNFMDRQILSILAEPIKHELRLSDTQIGLLSGLVFALFYSLLAIPVARLADRANRVRIIAVCCGIWSLFTLTCGLATSFLTLALSRTGVAVGEAGGTPPSYSIIADYFPPHQRATAAAIYSLGVPVGVLGGALAGGWLAASYGWRTAFIVVGVAGLILAPLLPLAIREPVRGQRDQATKTEAGMSLAAILKLFVTSRILLLAGLGAGLSSFTGYALIMWMPAFLIRSQGMSMADIAVYYSLVSGISLALGSWLGGFLTDWFGRKSIAAYGVIPALAALFAVPFLLMAVAAGNWQTALILLAIPQTLGMMYLPPAIAVVQNNLPADCRATGSAVLVLWFNIVGLGGGPLYVGMISDALAPAHGAQSLVHALQWLTPAYLLAAACHLAAARAMTKTVR